MKIRKPTRLISSAKFGKVESITYRALIPWEWPTTWSLNNFSKKIIEIM